MPLNLQVFATHGSLRVPVEFAPYLRPEFNTRLLRNFSDFATESLIRHIPDAQKLIPVYGRLAGDTNRALDAVDIFRSVDFHGISLFDTDLPKELLQKALEESYMPYHRSIVQRLLKENGDRHSKMLIVDLHDTGNLLLGEDEGQDESRKEVTNWEMPAIILSNNSGKTAPQYLMDEMRQQLAHFLQLDLNDIHMNDYYLGGYVTRHYGNKDNKDLQNAQQERDVMQIEIQRSLYMDEKTQRLKPDAIDFYGRGIVRALGTVAEGRRRYVSKVLAV